MSGKHDWLDRELQALADEDAAAGAPARVAASVMKAWDVMSGLKSAPTTFSWRPALTKSWRPALAGCGIVAAAAALIFILVRPAPDSSALDASEVVQAREFVLVPDPFADQTAMQVMRVRMSRTALASLGVPVADPGGGSLVEVELLVGDDGVARSIRRATFVNDTLQGGTSR